MHRATSLSHFSFSRNSVEISVVEQVTIQYDRDGGLEQLLVLGIVLSIRTLPFLIFLVQRHCHK